MNGFKNKGEIMMKDQDIQNRQNNQEINEKAKTAGMKAGSSAMLILAIALLLFDFIIGERIYMNAFQALIWAYLVADAYPQYKYTKRKSFLVIMIGGAIALVVSLVLFVQAVL